MTTQQRNLVNQFIFDDGVSPISAEIDALPAAQVGSRSATDPRHTLILSAGMAKVVQP